ncbi:MAG TPA: Rieske (2Fe-2S) protein [Polyangiaceae bacterium]|jgi:nitrite reductase/ring-hydroxylating ferredoxin subunit
MTTRVVLTEAQREEVVRGRFVRVAHGEGSALVGRAGGAWRAYENVCRHRALPLDLGAPSAMSDDGRYLLCHQHGALYRPGDGLCVSGPCAGEALTAVAIVETDDGSLLVG